jgi:hypothetical protein
MPPLFISLTSSTHHSLSSASSASLVLALAQMTPALLNSPEDGLSVIFDSHACNEQNSDDASMAGLGKEAQRCRGLMNEKQRQSGE